MLGSWWRSEVAHRHCHWPGGTIRRAAQAADGATAQTAPSLLSFRPLRFMVPGSVFNCTANILHSVAEFTALAVPRCNTNSLLTHLISAQDPIGTICKGYPLNVWYCAWFTALRELTQQFWGCSQCTVPWKNSATITSLGITLQLLISDKLWNTPMDKGKFFILLSHLVWHTVVDGSRNSSVSISRVEQTKELILDSCSLSYQTT